MRVQDYAVTEDQVEESVCPTCYADAGRLCTTPSGDPAEAPHARRVKKAQSVARDLDVAGCLPEHDPAAYAAAMTAARKRGAPQ